MRGFFALLALAATALGHPSWLLATLPANSPRPSFDSLVRELPVYAIMSRAVLLQGGEAEARRLEELGFWVRHQGELPLGDLAFVEFPPAMMGTVMNDFSRMPELSEDLLIPLFDLNLALFKSDKLEEYAPSLWASKLETLAVPKYPIVPSPTFEESPLYKRLQKIEPNPKIVQVLKSVSGDNMKSLVYNLSEGFYSRQSASPEIREAQVFLENLLSQYNLNVTTHTYRDDYSANVCGDIIGKRSPEKIVIAGAHYDSRSTDTNNPTLRAPGAVDNASGSAGMIEMARVLFESKLAMGNTVRFCLWSGEEQGLLGSDAYAKKMKSEGAEILAYFNADMTGYRLPNSPIIMGMKDRSITEWLLQLSYEITEAYVPGLPVELSYSCCSDYISFYNQGYPSIGYFQNPGAASDYPDYHKSTDTYEKNDYEQMTVETQAVLAAVLTFAEPI